MAKRRILIAKLAIPAMTQARQTNPGIEASEEIQQGLTGDYSFYLSNVQGFWE